MATVATKEKPILFSAPMVRAILDGRKTQTRRIVKPQPEWNGLRGNFGEFTWGSREMITPYEMRKLCPYGKPGDRLWVRERWAAWTTPSHEYPGDCDQIECPPSEMQERYGTTRHDCVYFADGPNYSKWRPSIHMPRWASRSTLEITDVRVQRLNEISDADAFAEGVATERRRESTWYAGKAKEMFRDLWSSINGSDSWDANPWVWAITFKKL